MAYNLPQLLLVYGLKLLCSAVFVGLLLLISWYSSPVERVVRQDVQAERDQAVAEAREQDARSSELQKMLDEANRDHQAWANDYGNKAQENIILQNRLDQYQALPDYPAQIWELEKANEKLEQSLETARRCVRIEESNSAKLSSKAKNAQHEIDAAKAKLDQQLYSFKVRHLEDLAVVRKERDAARKALAKGLSQLKEELRKASTKQCTHQDLYERCNYQDQVIAQLKADLSAQRAKFEAQVAEHSSQISKLSADVEAGEREYEELEVNHLDVTDKLNSATSQSEEAGQEIGRLQSQLEKLSLRLADNASTSTTTRTNTTADATATTTTDAATTTTTTTTPELTRLENERDQANQEVAEKVSRIEELEKLASQQEAELTALRTTSSHQQGETRQTLNLLQAKEADLAAKEADLAAKEAELQESNGELAAKNADIDNLRTALANRDNAMDTHADDPESNQSLEEPREAMDLDIAPVHDHSICAHQIADRDQQIAQMDLVVFEKNATIAKLQQEAQAQDLKINGLGQQLQDSNASVAVTARQVDLLRESMGLGTDASFDAVMSQLSQWKAGSVQNATTAAAHQCDHPVCTSQALASSHEIAELRKAKEELAQKVAFHPTAIQRLNGGIKELDDRLKAKEVELAAEKVGRAKAVDQERIVARQRFELNNPLVEEVRRLKKACQNMQAERDASRQANDVYRKQSIQAHGEVREKEKELVEQETQLGQQLRQTENQRESLLSSNTTLMGQVAQMQQQQAQPASLPGRSGGVRRQRGDGDEALAEDQRPTKLQRSAPE